MKDIVELHEKGFKYRQENYKYAFDLEEWKKSESYKIIKLYCDNKEERIFEIGCLTGHHLILLAQEGYKNLHGIDFVKEAIEWGKANSNNLNIRWETGWLDRNSDTWINKETKQMGWNFKDKIICFDVLEHQPNVGNFLEKILTYCIDGTEILFLVPKGEEYFDECHINFYPSIKSLNNLLEKYFKIIESYEVEDGKKLFFRCCV